MFFFFVFFTLLITTAHHSFPHKQSGITLLPTLLYSQPISILILCLFHALLRFIFLYFCSICYFPQLDSEEDLINYFLEDEDEIMEWLSTTCSIDPSPSTPCTEDPVIDILTNKPTHKSFHHKSTQTEGTYVINYTDTKDTTHTINKIDTTTSPEEPKNPRSNHIQYLMDVKLPPMPLLDHWIHPNYHQPPNIKLSL